MSFKYLQSFVVLASVIFTYLSAGQAFGEESKACKIASETAVDWAVRACAVETEKALNEQLGQAWNRLQSDARKFDAASVAADHNGVKMFDTLVVEQKAWTQYKNLVCGYYWKGNFFGSGGRDFNGASCVDDVVKQRIKYLNEADEFLRSSM